MLTERVLSATHSLEMLQVLGYNSSNCPVLATRDGCGMLEAKSKPSCIDFSAYLLIK